MNYRISQINELRMPSRWLDDKHSESSYEYALSFSSSTRYGLNEKMVRAICSHKIDSYSVAGHWLKSNFPKEGNVQIVFGAKEVLVVSSSDFLANWENIFVPGRDDAIILHSDSNCIAFYCHEEEIEIGQRCA